MACAACERRRKLMKEALAKGMAHAARLLALRRGESPDVQTEGATEQAAVTATEAGEATGDQQAGGASTAHGEQGVAKPATSRAAKGQPPVPKVRKARGRP